MGYLTNDGYATPAALLYGSGGNLVVADTDLNWETDGGGAIGSGTKRPATIDSSGAITAGTTVASGTTVTAGTNLVATGNVSGTWIGANAAGGFYVNTTSFSNIRGGDLSDGQGAGAYGLDFNQAETLRFNCKHASFDAADKRVMSFFVDTGAATLTNAATMRLASYGRVTDADAYVEEFAIMGNGTVKMAAHDADSAPGGVAGQVAYFSNGKAGDPILAFYDGSNWVRVDDGATAVASFIMRNPTKEELAPLQTIRRKIAAKEVELLRQMRPLQDEADNALMELIEVCEAVPGLTLDEAKGLWLDKGGKPIVE